LNTEGPSLAGFRLQDGGLDPIPDTPRALPDGSDPAQVGFSPDGTGIVVTNRGTDSIILYAADESGRLGEPTEQPSSGPTPYGFAFANDGTLVVTRGVRGAEGQGCGFLVRPQQRVDQAGLPLGWERAQRDLLGRRDE
jgi:hypothetical protein